MCCEPPSTYLVWQGESDRWLPGDIAPLCARHAVVMRERIQRAEVSGCELLATKETWETPVNCAWDFSWPLTDEFRILQTQKL